MADIIVVGNEKGGAGKSTLAIHLMTALLHEGARVGALDLDVRQQSLSHFIDNRAAWLAANGAEAPMPETVRMDAGLLKAPEDAARDRLAEAFEALAACDIVVVDTPG
ncbi:MAG: division plane positioning ATPase MipZ, partial [Phenylobacterium sp.]